MEFEIVRVSTEIRRLSVKIAHSDSKSRHKG